MTSADGGTKPEADREGDLDDDRQDPPLPEKTGEDQELDGFKPTPGDQPDTDAGNEG